MNPTNNYEKYADIINLPHQKSAKRPHMPMEDRAAQFSPFAALTGYEDAVKETARLTDERIELDEYSKEFINRKLSELKNDLDRTVKITYFVPDERKEGGTYATVSGCVKKMKEQEMLIIMEDGTEIPISEIIEIVEI